MGYQVMNKIEMEPSGLSETYFHTMMRLMGENRDIMELEADLGAVSYTHLTLPTKA